MTRAFVVCLGLAAALLASCTPPPPTARIVVFSASDERIPRNTDVTLLWQAADAGVQEGFPSCVLTRRFGDEITETPVQATCAGSVTEVPPAPLDATTVEYRFKVLKQPYDPADPYVTQARAIVLDPALYAIRAGGSSIEDATAVSTLPDGSAVVTGFFTGTADFGTGTLASSGAFDVFVARIQPDGTWAWATRAGGADSDRAAGVSALADGSAVVAGHFLGTTVLGTTTLPSAGGTDVFVARIQPDGTWDWANRAGGSSSDFAWAVASLADGGAIVSGEFQGTATFGTTDLVSGGAGDAFVARIDPDGAWAWATRAGGPGSVRALGVATLADGGAIVAGSFSGTATFGSTTLASAGSSDLFVARIRPDGAWAWATRGGGASGDRANAVSALEDGGAIVAGHFTGTTTIGTTTLVSAGNEDVFVTRIDLDGAWAWATRAGGTDTARASSVGTLADGGAVVAGDFAGTATFGTTTLVSAGGTDAFVARIHPDGTWSWAARGGGSDLDEASGVATLDDGGAIVLGDFLATAAFGATALTSAGADDVFIARISTDGAW